MANPIGLPPVLIDRLEALRKTNLRSKFETHLFEVADERFIRRNQFEEQVDVVNEYRRQRELIWVSKGVRTTKKPHVWTRKPMQSTRNYMNSAIPSLAGPPLLWIAHVVSFANRYALLESSGGRGNLPSATPLRRHRGAPGTRPARQNSRPQRLGRDVRPGHEPRA